MGGGNAVSGFVAESVECRGEEGVVCSQPSWIGVMKLNAWSSPSTFPMTATCRWTTVLGSKVGPEDQCRWWYVDLSTKVRLGELALWRSIRVVDDAPWSCIVLLDVVERPIARSRRRDSCLGVDTSLEVDRGRDERLGRRVERRRRGLRWTEIGRLSCRDEERWRWERDFREDRC